MTDPSRGQAVASTEVVQANQSTAIPQHWRSLKLRNVCELINGRAYKQEELLTDGKYRVLRVGNFFTNNHWYYSDLELADNKYCDAGDLLYAWSASFGPRIWSGEKVIFHYHIWKVIPDSALIDQRFLFMFFLWDTERIKEDQGTGTTMIHVSKQSMEDRSIPLPPLPEQRCVVAKLQSLLEHSNRTRDELRRIPSLIQRYKLAILAAAFRGNLAAGQSSDWPSKPLSEIADLQLGKMLDKAKNKGVPSKYLRNVSVRWFAFDLSDLPEMPFTNTEQEKFSIKDGDILICEGGEPGRAAIWREGDTKIKYQKAIHRVRVHKGYKPEWIVYQLFYAAHAGILSEHFTGTTIKHLPQEALAQVPFLAPPEEVQARLIAVIERAFLAIDKLSLEATRALMLLNRLDQAILAKAFRGELVPQQSSEQTPHEEVAAE